MNSIWKGILIDLIIDAGKVAGAMVAILGGLWAFGWIVEALYQFISIEISLVTIFAIAFFAVFGGK